MFYGGSVKTFPEVERLDGRVEEAGRLGLVGDGDIHLRRVEGGQAVVIKGGQQADDAVRQGAADLCQPGIFAGLAMTRQAVQARLDPFDMSLGYQVGYIPGLDGLEQLPLFP